MSETFGVLARTIARLLAKCEKYETGSMVESYRAAPDFHHASADKYLTVDRNL